MKTYENLIEKFWEFNKKHPLGATASALYLFLLNIWNKNNENFVLSDFEISNELKITRPTIITLKKLLRDLGLIHFQTKNGLPTHYKIILDYSIISEEKPKKSIKTKEQPKPEQKFAEEKQKENLFIEQNTETKSIETQTIAEEKPKIIKERNNKPKPAEFVPPAMDEVLKYVEGTIYKEYLSNPEFVFQLENRIEKWKSNGWKTDYGNKINDWKATVAATIPHIKTSNNNHSPQDFSAIAAEANRAFESNPISLRKPKSNFKTLPDV